MHPSATRRFTPAKALQGLLATAALLFGHTALADQPVDHAKVTLVLGDQARNLRSMVEAAGVLENTPYAYRWANFQGAAPLFEAQRAGAVDTSYAGDLPVLAAAAGGVPLKIIATNAGYGSGNGLLVQADSPLRQVKDLKGHSVVVSSAKGSISQHLLYEALREAGLRRSDVTLKFVLPTDASAAFNAGQIDAWAVFDPYLGIAERNGARLLRNGEGLTSALSFVTATESSLADPAKRAAIADVVRRFAQARQWAIEHPQEYAKVYAELTHLPLDTAAFITQRASRGLRPVTAEDIEKVQKVADLFHEVEVLPQHVDVQAITDRTLFTSDEAL
ncbi:ABC transporter substrate-binding protein [Azomonas macrocytogenes]|uniref:Putative aliphatic sulfonates-binding protein n=1 Tax=Azomonas macrocytogenes TaxID=69962 RepID=A0A839SYI7_AZOMA|nr:ABC transporter substrate-binding protein [Azomonas macrocytogenes]MBB3102192.1 sulfonate transport system substrate-binding protein [Azomonas macrocytogenes]